MKRMGSVQVSVVTFVVLLACYWNVEYDTEADATIPAQTAAISESTKQIHRKMRETYRQPELPIFGTEDTADESIMNVPNSENRTRNDDEYRHHRPVQKHIKKSSYPSSLKSSSTTTSIKSSSSKKSSKRGGFLFTMRPSSLPSVVPTTVTPTMTPPTTIPTASMIPSIRPTSSQFPTPTPSQGQMTPNPTPGITNSPTAARSFAIEAPTYSLFFFFDDTTGNIRTTDEDFVELGEVTRVFLDDYFDNRYGSTVIITFNQALTEVVGFSSITLPIQTFFLTTALYSETSIFYPPRSEVEREIEKAFTTFGSNFEYLMAIRGLPASNPFQTISSVNWGGYGTG